MRRSSRLGIVALVLSIFLAGSAAEITYAQYIEDPPEISYFEPLSALNIPDEATIVGFGEATHGNHDFKALATDVFKNLVLEKGFRAFALEAHFGNCIAINEYILYGKGTAKAAVRNNGFWVHRFQEVVDLVEWMREYNLEAIEGDKLHFYGYDIQEVKVSGELFMTFMQTIDVKKAKQYEPIFEDVLSSELYSRDESTLRDMLDNVDKIIAEVEQSKESYTLASSKSDYDFALRNAICVRNEIELSILNNNESASGSGSYHISFNYRDKCMSDNIRWIVEREESLGRGKVFVFAHNGHIGKSRDEGLHVMGRHLSSEYGKRYFAIGTNYYTSSFIAYNHGKRLAEGKLINDSGELINLFIDANIDIGVIDIKKNAESGGDMERILKSNQEIGRVGSVYDQSYPASVYTEQIVPYFTYDAMILVRNATPAAFFR